MKYLLAISLILLVGALQPSALAHTMNTAKSQSKSTPALRERTFKKLSEAQKQIEEEKANFASKHATEKGEIEQR